VGEIGYMHLLRKFFKKSGAEGDKQIIVSSDEGQRLVFNKNRNPALRASVCFAPSVNMIFSENGFVKACCHNNENVMGKYPEQSISEIWNSRDAKNFRQNMAAYHFLSGCGVCERDYHKGAFNEMPSRHFDDLPQVRGYPTMMEFMLSNTCNLECVMCTGELSSAIRKNRDKLPPIKSPYDDKFIAQLKEFIPYLVETRFSSAGEAFLIDMNFKLWEMLIADNRDCLIVVQTNGTVLNGRVKDFLARGNFKIGVSLDSLQKETFESIRVNATFERVMENIDFFAEYSKMHKRQLNISTCVMRENWHELPDFIHFCNKIGATATFHKVWLPQQNALYNLPAHQLQEIYNQLCKHDFPVNSILEKKNKKHYDYFVSCIGNWAKDAASNVYEMPNLESLSNNELLQFISQNFKLYIFNQHMLESNPGELLQLCQHKIEQIMDLCSTDEQRKAHLMALARTPVSFSLPAIKSNSVEKLFEMSINQIKA
jgi:MoaA/NifB/PqqE/SkfB family radical SAM enzyme